jgi:hypothetical protein
MAPSHSLTLAERVIAFLDGHAKHYAKLSGRKRIGYADYVKLGLSDEERFVQPEFVPK